RRRLDREWLRRPGFLARHVALGYGTLLDWPQRLAAYAIEDVQQSELGRLRHDIDRLAVVFHREKLGTGGRVVIPQIVMDQLVVPQPFPRAQIQSEQAIAE